MAGGKAAFWCGEPHILGGSCLPSSSQCPCPLPAWGREAFFFRAGELPPVLMSRCIWSMRGAGCSRDPPGLSVQVVKDCAYLPENELKVRASSRRRGVSVLPQLPRPCTRSHPSARPGERRQHHTGHSCIPLSASRPAAAHAVRRCLALVVCFAEQRAALVALRCRDVGCAGPLFFRGPGDPRRPSWRCRAAVRSMLLTLPVARWLCSRYRRRCVIACVTS